MKDTFDLRKYLVENKMTENSRKGTRRRLDGTVLTESYSGDSAGSSLEESITDPEAIYEDFDETVSDNAFLESVVGDADSITLNVLGHELYIDYAAEEDGEGCDVDGVFFTDCDPSLIKKLTGALNRGNYKVVEKDGQSLREGRFLGRRTVSEAKKKKE